MPTASASVVQYGRRKGSPTNNQSQEIESAALPQLDLRKVTILPKSEWLRIQDNLDSVNKSNERIMEAAKQREAMHLRSKEVVKYWSNTIAGQRQKKLAAKKLREEVEEEERKKIDMEEAKYQAEKRKEAIEKAKAQQYYQTDRVMKFHSALLLTEVLKEREAQIELKRRIHEASRDSGKDLAAAQRRQDQEAQRQDMEKEERRKQESENIVRELLQQMKEHETAADLEKQENQREGKRLWRLKELFDQEQAELQQKIQDDKRNLMKTYNEHSADMDMHRAVMAQKEQVEDEKCQMFAEAKVKMSKMRREIQEERRRQQQKLRDVTIAQLTAYQEERKAAEEDLISKAMEEKERREARKLQLKQEERDAMIQSIAVHREATRQEMEQKEREERQNASDLLHAKKEADRVFLEKQLLKAQRMREDGQALQKIYIHQMAEKQARQQKQKKDLQEFEVMNSALVAEEERQFQRYAAQLIQTAQEAQRDPSLLRRAAREGIGGGLGPLFGGVRPSYLVQDDTGVQMPNYVGPLAQEVREMNETTDIHCSKKRLGFTW